MAIVALKIEGDPAQVEQAVDSIKALGLAVEALEVDEKQAIREGVPALCLKEMRLLAKLTQRQLAGLVGIPQRHISEMENGKRPIGKENAKRFAKVLKTHYQMFL